MSARTTVVPTAITRPPRERVRASAATVSGDEVRLSRKGLLQADTPSSVYARPESPFVASFVGDGAVRYRAQILQWMGNQCGIVEPFDPARFGELNLCGRAVFLDPEAHARNSGFRHAQRTDGVVVRDRR